MSSRKDTKKIDMDRVSSYHGDPKIQSANDADSVRSK